MTLNFPAFARLVAATFQHLTKNPAVFVSGVTGDDLYAAYIASFPEGTNPLFKKVSEHECSSCRNFIRRVGNIVTVGDDGHIFTIWDPAVSPASGSARPRRIRSQSVCVAAGANAHTTSVSARSERDRGKTMQTIEEVQW